MRRFCFLVILLSLSLRLTSAAQPKAASELEAAAEPEAAPLVVMNLAAHPDDEDGSTLAYYRHARNAVAYSVIYTRGEGGQNEIGPQLYEALGAIRTKETERAARHLGTQVFFLNFKDFGFSKSAEETFNVWGGREEVTSRLVYFIRKLKPDVLFTNHDTVTVGPGRQHGHHQAVGISAYDAFALAADASYHPEQLLEEGVDLWQPKRMFRRLWSEGDHQVAVPVGNLEPQTGVSYAAMAGQALHEHASQGMTMFAGRIGEWQHTFFVLSRSSTDAPLSTTDLAANLPPNHEADPDVSYWIDSGRLASLASGSLSIADTVVVPGQTVRITWTAEHLPARPLRIRFFGAADTTIVVRDDDPPRADLRIRRDFEPTMPKEAYQYEHHTSHPPLGFALYDVSGERLLSGGYVPMEVAPPVYLDAEADVVRLRDGTNAIPYDLRVYDRSLESIIVTTAVSSDADRTILDQHQETFSLSSANDTHANVRLPLAPEPGDYTIALTALASRGSAETGSASRLTATKATTRPTASATDFLRARVFDVRVPDQLRVGVIESYDNTLDRALDELGVDHVMLDSAALAHSTFDDLQTIVIDIRAYLVRQDLRMYNDRLLGWVRRGGHLIVNYHKTFDWNEGSQDPFNPSRRTTASFAPYPLELGRERVTREDAPITLLEPEHVLFQRPNRIRPDDWDGWVQERGLYFPSSYDERYLELLSLNDPGEPPLTSSTLLARVGEGTYMYTALVWYRQLKDHHPGAYKMFANMISLPLFDERTAGP